MLAARALPKPCETRPTWGAPGRPTSPSLWTARKLRRVAGAGAPSKPAALWPGTAVAPAQCLLAPRCERVRSTPPPTPQTLAVVATNYHGHLRADQGFQLLVTNASAFQGFDFWFWRQAGAATTPPTSTSSALYGVVSERRCRCKAAPPRVSATPSSPAQPSPAADSAARARPCRSTARATGRCATFSTRRPAPHPSPGRPPATMLAGCQGSPAPGDQTLLRGFTSITAATELVRLRARALPREGHEGQRRRRRGCCVRFPWLCCVRPLPSRR